MNNMKMSKGKMMAKASASAGSPMQKMMMMNKAKKTMAPKAKPLVWLKAVYPQRFLKGLSVAS